jgi:hypothetical protein
LDLERLGSAATGMVVFEEDATIWLFAKSTYAAVILIFRIIIPRIVFIAHLSPQSYSTYQMADKTYVQCNGCTSFDSVVCSNTLYTDAYSSQPRSKPIYVYDCAKNLHRLRAAISR